MPQTPDWAKYLSAGVEFVAITRTQARARAKELVSQGQLAQSQVQGFVDELVDESRRRTDSMMDVVRQEIGRQVKTLGIATKDDLAAYKAMEEAGVQGFVMRMAIQCSFKVLPRAKCRLRLSGRAPIRRD